MNIRFSSRTHLIQAPQKRISIHGINKKRDCLDLENTKNTTKDCRSSSFVFRSSNHHELERCVRSYRSCSIHLQ